MKYFTIEELCKTSTGLDNTPGQLEISNLKNLVDHVLDPLRVKYGKPITINSGFRSLKVNKKVGGVSTSQHCLDEQSEILTSTGWKNVHTINYEDKLYTYNTNTNNIELCNIDNIICYNYKGTMNMATNKHIDYCVTPEHRMYVCPESVNKTFRFELSKLGYNKRRTHKVSGTKNGEVLEYDINMLRLCMATVADGCVYTKKGCKNPFIRFNLKKERDINELLDILSKLGIRYNYRYCKNRELQGQSGVYEYTIESTFAKPIIDIIGKNKKIPWWLLKYDSDVLRQLVVTYIKFDGSIDGRNNSTGMTIYSIDEENIDILQAMSILSGFRTVKKEFKDLTTTYGTMDKFYNLYLAKKETSRLNESTYSTKEYDGIVWCVSNINETIIVRRNGKVFITGNCKGEAADITGGNRAENIKLFNLIKESGKYDQLINEYDYKWVHVSYKTSGNRKQIVIVK